MPKEVIWSPESEKDLDKLLDYLATDWDTSVVLKFIDLLEVLVDQISYNPLQFPSIKRKLNIRKCVITKHNSLFYRNKRGNVEILRIYDTRQDPESLEFI